MKTFEDFNNTDEKENIFLELAHLDELEIRFDFIRYEYELYFFYKDNCLFEQYKKSKDFYIKYEDIWSVFETKYDLKNQEIEEFMTIMVDKYFKLKDYTTNFEFRYRNIVIEKHFKL